MIENLELKLQGLQPVTREELLELVSSWGRRFSFTTTDYITVLSSKVGQCYDLSKLDLSEITDLSYIFYGSNFNGDLSKWDVSKVENMENLFSYSTFNGDLSSWNVSNIVYINNIRYIPAR